MPHKRKMLMLPGLKLSDQNQINLEEQMLAHLKELEHFVAQTPSYLSGDCALPLATSGDLRSWDELSYFHKIGEIGSKSVPRLEAFVLTLCRQLEVLQLDSNVELKLAPARHGVEVLGKLNAEALGQVGHYFSLLDKQAQINFLPNVSRIFSAHPVDDMQLAQFMAGIAGQAPHVWFWKIWKELDYCRALEKSRLQKIFFRSLVFKLAENRQNKLRILENTGLSHEEMEAFHVNFSQNLRQKLAAFCGAEEPVSPVFVEKQANLILKAYKLPTIKLT